MDTNVKRLADVLGKNVSPTNVDEVVDLARIVCRNPEALRRLHRRIRQERVILQAYDNAYAISRVREGTELNRILEALQKDYDYRRVLALDLIPTAREEVVSYLNEAGVNFLLIKGASLRGYPHGYLRQVNDLDIIVETWDELFRAVQVLEGLGFSHHDVREPHWTTRILYPDVAEREMVAHMSLVRIEGSHFIKIDLHSSPLTSGPISALRCDMWRRSLSHRSYEMPSPTPEDQILIVIAHAVSEGHFITKDFNDIYALLIQGEESFDWTYVCHCLQQSRLAYAAHYALNRVHLEYRQEIVPREVLRILHRNDEKLQKTILAIATNDDKERLPQVKNAVLQILQIGAYGKTHQCLGYGTRMAFGHVLWSCRFSASQGKIGGRAWARWILHSRGGKFFPVARRGQVLLLVPAANICDDLGQEEVSAAARQASALLQEVVVRRAEIKRVRVRPLSYSTYVVRLGTSEALLTPADVFVPTIDAGFTESEVRDIRSLIVFVAELSRHHR